MVEILGEINVLPLVSGRGMEDRPNKVNLSITFGGKTITTKFEDIKQSNLVSFDDKFVFSTKANQPTDADGDNKLVVKLGEPGLAAARQKQPDPNDNQINCCICCFKCSRCYARWGYIVVLSILQLVRCPHSYN